MPNETIDELKIGLSIDWSKAEKEAQSRGLAIGKSIADSIDKATKYRLNKTSRKANRSDGIHWASYLSGGMGAHPRLNTGGSFFERLISGASGNRNVSFFSRGGQTRFGEFAGALQDRLSGLASSAPDFFGNAVAKAKEFAGALRPIGGFVVKQIKKPFENVAKSISDAHKRVERFRATIARIVLYRTIRAMMSAIKKAVQEGVQNLYQYSQTIGTTFSESIDTIYSSALFIKNAFAAMVAPLVNQIAPVVREIAVYIGEAANNMAEFFTLVTKGAGAQYSRAIWFMKKYKDEASGAKKMLDLLGIDEINRLTDKSSSGSGDDYSAMFEEAIAGENISDVGESFAKQIADSIANGDWPGVGKAIADKLNDAVDRIGELGIGAKVGEKINHAVQLAGSFLEGVSFENISGTIVKFLQDLNLDWNAIGNAWMQWKLMIPRLVVGVFETLDWGSIGKSIGEFFKGTLDGLSDWIQRVDWGGLGEKVFQGFIDLLANINIGEIIKKIVNLFGQVLGAVGNFFLGLARQVWTSIISAIKGDESSYKPIQMVETSNGYFEVDPATRNRINQNAYNDEEHLKKLSMLADGGYVPTGDLFIANEAGPELVGTMNGKTYVGSNQDINAVGIGIENAVYAMANMVVQAINRKDTSVNLDGKTLARGLYQPLKDEDSRRGVALAR